MRIECIGGGPAGLYFALLMKKSFPAASIRVRERNRPDDTFGWGVVFSDETLGGFQQADPESFAEIRRSFVTWGDIETTIGSACVRSQGHGFCGLSRKRLLDILQGRCRALGVELHFQSEVDAFPQADLVVVADGVNSAFRTRWENVFRPTITLGRCRFAWLGTEWPLNAFTFLFRENEHGLHTVHAYPFERGDRTLSTFIVECHEDTWRAAGFEGADEAATVAYYERLFADRLEGHRLLSNRSLWRTFPEVRCETWHHENAVLLGDAAHTAHFSIGSGTKLAMEDSIALVQAFGRGGARPIRETLADYEQSRRLDVAKLQRAARVSQRWFEECKRYVRQAPEQFNFNLMTRSRKITYENLKLRDPGLVERVDRWFANGARSAADLGARSAADLGARSASNGVARVPPIFTPLRLRHMELANRIVVSPMCQYSAQDGTPNDWHLVHLGSRAVGGAGLVIAEATNVSSQGRISPGCTGLYTDEHERAWKRIVDFVHAFSRSKIGLQLGHAGRKASCSVPWEGDQPLVGPAAWSTIGPSALPFGPNWPTPAELDAAGMRKVLDEFVLATHRAERAGFDLLELHMAHGYLLSSFLSPLSNQRRDDYGGSLERRLRFPLEVTRAVRAVWPAEKPLAARISASDWLDDQGGQTIDDAVQISRALAQAGCDLIDVSSAGNDPRSRPEYGRMYQVGFADRIRNEAHVPVMAVGAILDADHANTVLAAGRADLCAIARAHLSDPYLTLHAAARYGVDLPDWPRPYLAVKPRN